MEDGFTRGGINLLGHFILQVLDNNLREEKVGGGGGGRERRRMEGKVNRKMKGERKQWVTNILSHSYWNAKNAFMRNRLLGNLRIYCALLMGCNK